MNEKLYVIFVWKGNNTKGNISFYPTVYCPPFTKYNDAYYKCFAIDFHIKATLAYPMKCNIERRCANLDKRTIESFSLQQEYNEPYFIQRLNHINGRFTYRTNNYFRFIRMLKSMPCLIAKNFGESYINTHMIGYNKNVVKVIEKHLSKNIIN